MGKQCAAGESRVTGLGSEEDDIDAEAAVLERQLEDVGVVRDCVSMAMLR